MRLSVRCLVTGTVLLALLLVGGRASRSLAQGQEEPSPIEIELVVPPQAGPGKTIDVLIQYDAVDIKAGADINYNFLGPGRIWTRDPEPPNPLVNTWKPTWSNPKGTIKIQLLIDEGTDGQAIQHMVEVRWGPKNRKFEATTQIKYIPPTATPTVTPRPRPTQAVPTATPVPVRPTLALSSARFVDLERQPIEAANVNQVIALAITYASSGALEDATLVVRFDPDVVNLDEAQYTDGRYAFSLASLPAAPSGAPLFEVPLQGRIRPYADGGEQYELRAIVELQVPEGATVDVPGEVIAAPIRVSQPMLLRVMANVETQIVERGGSVIVHARCENPGPTPVKWIRLQVNGLPEGFAVSPDEQTIDLIAENGGSQERLFTIRAPDDYKGSATLKVVGTWNGETIESEPVVIELVSPTELSLDAVISQSAVRAGQVFYVDTICTNNGWFVAKEVTVKLIDTTGNLGVLFQDLGDIGPGESRKAVFVVEVPIDFPADVVVSLAAQATSEEGTVNQSEAIPIRISCVPVLEIGAQAPSGRARGGQSVEVVVTLGNVSQCVSKEVIVSLLDLPGGFAEPAAQKISELAPGAVRHLTFNVLIPEGYLGEAALKAQASDSAGVQVESLPTLIRVGGVSTAFIVLFGLLALIAIAAIVVGTVLYFRNR